MALRQDFAEQVKAQTEVWRGQIKAYQEQMEQAGAKTMADYKKAMAQMEAKAEEARRLAEQVQSANEIAWKDMPSCRRVGPTRSRASADDTHHRQRPRKRAIQ
jgi:hypothetical protein